MRKIPKTLALMSLLAPLGAHALGIGDIRLHSALNQSLIAEIPLVTSGGEELSDVRVSLASPEAFARAGIERHYALTKLRFTPEQRPDGSYVIKITSQGSIHEPFLNFLIEVHWPQGRLQREFTVLLDPPAEMQEAQAQEDEAELPETAAYQRPVERPSRRAPVEAEPAPPSSRPRRPTREEVAAAAPPPAPAEQIQVAGPQYGPVGRSETLWSIAKQQSQATGVNQEAMLQAIFRANPHAFYRNNINALKAGETLTIPDRDSVARLAGAPSAAPVLHPAGKLAARPERSEEQAQAQPPAQGQLKLVAPSPSKSIAETATSGAKGKAGKSKEELAPEINSVKQENEEIRRSLSELKDQLSSIQRLLVLKDEQIATLQAQQKQAPRETAPAPNAPVPAPTPATPAQTAKPPVTAEPPKQPVPTPPPVQAAQPKPPAPPQQPPETAATAQPPAQPAIQHPPAQPKPASAPAKKEESLAAEMMEHPSLVAIGGILGILALSVWIIKRRRAAMIDETESILTLGDREKTIQPRRPPISLGQPTSGISEQSSVTAASRSSFLSEFTPSDFDALGGEMEEVDPISEADVYLAYGRYKQAEELIRSAIAQNPERDECKIKLLEIHYATENAQAFEKFAEELEPTHKDAKPEFWEKVVEMGQELCPESPLFNGGVVPPPAPAAPARFAESMAEAEAELEEDYFFKKKPEESHGHAAPSAVAPHRQTPEESPESIAYDFFATEGKKEPAGPGLEESIDLEGEEVEYPPMDNVIAFEPAGKPKQPAASAAVDDEVPDKTLDDILAELGVLSEPTKPEPQEEEQTLQAETENDDNSIDFDAELKQMLEASKTGKYFEPEPEEAADDNHLPLLDMDEQETKLDLAKAYFDMGDEEAARVILENVAEQGNDAQKEEAWSLLNRLSRKEVNRR